MSLPARFEGLAAEVMTEGGSGEDLVTLLAVISQGSRERILLGLSKKKGLIEWLGAATLVPTPQVLTEAVEFACHDLQEMEADPEFKSDLPEYIGEVATKLAGFGDSIAPMLETAKRLQPAKSAASKAAARALKDLRKQ
jgi:hypothetical protein